MEKTANTRKAKIGVIQPNHIISEKTEQKYGRLMSLAEKCYQEDADLVFFPEAYQYTGDDDIIRRREELLAKTKAWKDRCSALAKKHHAYLVPWDYELNEDGKIYNTSYILDRNGNEIGRHRKCQLTYREQLTDGLGRGTEFKVFNLAFGKVGIMICFDNYFPESARALGLLGAELVLYPLYGDTLVPQWELKLRARAIDNSMYIASAQIDMKAMEKGASYSGMVDPEGNIVCRLDQGDRYSVMEIEMGKPVVTNTGAVPHCKENLKRYLEKQRNPEAYGVLTQHDLPTWSWDEIISF